MVAGGAKELYELEAELECQLNPAWTTAAQERVANADVGGGAELVTAAVGGRRADFTRVGASLKSATAGTEVRSWVGNKRRQQGTGELGMVDDGTEAARPVKAVPAAAVIVFAIVVEGKGLATL